MRPSHFPRALYPFSWAASSLTSGNSRRHRNRSQSEMLVRRIRAPARTAPADSSGPAYSSSENGADSSHIRRHRGSSCRCNSYAYDVFFPRLAPKLQTRQRHLRLSLPKFQRNVLSYSFNTRTPCEYSKSFAIRRFNPGLGVAECGISSQSYTLRQSPRASGP